MSSQTELLNRFIYSQANRLQKQRPADLRIVRKIQPLIDRREMQHISKDEQISIENNRIQFLEIYKKLSYGIAKLALKVENNVNKDDLDEFLAYLNFIPTMPNFPFYGSLFKDYMKKNRKQAAATLPLFSNSSPAAAERFLYRFRNLLEATLVKCACLSDFSDTQQNHVVFHAAHALHLVFQDYLIKSRKYVPL